MAQVRGHYRKNGSYVRPHTRRSRPAGVPPARSVLRSHPAPARRSTGPTTHVRGHYRSNGSRVRPHRRRLGSSVTAKAGGSALVLFLLALALLSVSR